MIVFRKLKTSRGFSIGELLVATLILLMVSSVVVGGIPVARDAYNKVTIGANSQVLLSTAISALRNELGAASDVRVGDDNSFITYISGSTGRKTKLYKSGENGIMITEYKYDSDDVWEGRERRLVSEAASTEDLYVTFESLSPTDAPVTDGVLSINDLIVKRASDSDDTKRAELSQLKIRIIRAS